MTHLTRRDLEAWHAGELDHDRARVIAHLAACAACAEQLANIERQASGNELETAIEMAPFRAAGLRAGAAGQPAAFDWRRLGLAAVLVLAVGSAAYYSMRRDGGGAERGGAHAALTLNAPSGDVAAGDVLRFTWTGSVPHTRVIIIDLSTGSEPVIDRAVTGNALELDAADRAKLAAGKPYRWFIEYRDATGVLQSTATMQFRIR